MYTAAEAAKKLNCSLRTIQQKCKILGIRKRGKYTYIIEENEIKQIKALLHYHPGRPWPKKDAKK